jgi:Tfp pilus assembly protein PilE
MSSRSDGFTLIELLLALVTTLVLSMMVFHLFHHNERVIRDQTLMMEMQQTARVVASQIADEIRMAGQEVPVYSSNQDSAMSESVVVILATSTNSRIDFRAGLSNTETGVTGTPPLDLTLGMTRTLAVNDGPAFSTALGTTIPFGRFVYVWGPTSNSTWAWIRAELIAITSTTLTITPRQSSNMENTIHFIRLPTVSLEEAVSIYLSNGSVRRATAADMRYPDSPAWFPSNEIGKNFTSLNFTYYDRNDNVLPPTTLSNRTSIARIDVQLTVQTTTPLSNGTQPSYSLALRTIPRNVTLRSAN